MSDYEYDSDRPVVRQVHRQIKIYTRIVYGIPDELGSSDKRVISRGWLEENYPRLAIYSGKIADNCNVCSIIAIECDQRRGTLSYTQEDKDELIRFIRHYKDYYGERSHTMDNVVLNYIPVMYGNFREFSRTYTLDDY